MKTKYKFIHFVEFKDGLWLCKNNKSNDELGYLEFYSRWKQWTFRATAMAVFNSTCLDDISDFLKQLNAGGK